MLNTDQPLRRSLKSSALVRIAGSMPVFHSRHRVGPQKIAAFVAVGFVIGSVLGYIFMATVHAVSGGDRHVMSL